MLQGDASLQGSDEDVNSAADDEDDTESMCDVQ